MRFLASVADVGEGHIALAAGADILDLKDPSQGALGAWAAPALRAAVRDLGGSRPVSATTGDLPMKPGTVRDAAAEVAATGVDYVKVGIFAGGDPIGCIEALRTVDARLIAVMMADQQPDLELLPQLAAAGFAGVMLDTAGKAGGRLLDHRTLAMLRDFVACARGLGLLTGLAGSLRCADITALAVAAPDYLGFRGALCRGGRTSGLDPAACRAVRQALDASNATATAGAQVSIAAA